MTSSLLDRSQYPCLRDSVYLNQASYGHIGNQFWIVAEHGMKAGYVRNIERDPHVRLKLHEGLRFRWHAGTGHLLPDDDPRKRQRWLANQLPSSAGNARAVRLSEHNCSRFGLTWNPSV